jgi:hypothetical protein
MSDDDNAVLATGLVDDLKSIGIKSLHSDLKTMIEMVTGAGKPVDDRELVVSLTPVNDYLSIIAN